MPTSRLMHLLVNIHTTRTHTHLSCDVWCAMGSRWVESQCWLSLHWAPQGVFIVAKINKATVTKRRLDHRHRHEHTHAYAVMLAHALRHIHIHTGNSQKRKQEKKQKQSHTLTERQKLTKTCLFWHAKKRAQLDYVFSDTHIHRHTHSHTTSSHDQSQSKKKIILKN